MATGLRAPRLRPSHAALPLLVLLLPIGATAAPRDTTFVLPDRRTPQGSDITIAGPDEPGERLVIEGRVLDAGKPLSCVTVYVYHADSMGWYARGEESRGNRLAGVLRTNRRGEYRVHTVMPGAYDHSGRGHLHAEVWSAGLPRKAFWRACWARLDSTGVRHMTWDLPYERGFLVALPATRGVAPATLRTATPANGSSEVPDSLRITPHAP